MTGSSVPRTLLLSGVALVSLAGCRERMFDVGSSPDKRIQLLERRTSGALAAPDSVKVYARAAHSDSSKRLIFEGQDVGKICYSWIDPETLRISISGGYPDQLATAVKIEGQLVRVQYAGVTSECVWRRRDPA